MKSLADRINESIESRTIKREKDREELKRKILYCESETDTKRELYKIKAQRAINKAKSAANPAIKNIAMNELKLYYGLYHYMGTLNTAFLAMQSQIEMQDLTSEFANLVNGLTKIKVPDKNVDYNKLTLTALQGFKPVDNTGLNKMVDDLIRGSFVATDSANANNAFFEALITGDASLDDNYHSETLEAFDQKQENAAAKNTSAKNDDLMNLLHQITAALNEP